MKTLTKYENLKEMEVKLYESIFRDEYDNVEMPTYGIILNGVIFDDIHCEKNIVDGLIKLITNISKDQTAKKLLHQIFVEIASTYDEELINL